MSPTTSITRRMPLRLKLVLWVVAVFGAILASLSVAIVLYLEHVERSLLDHRLTRLAHRIADAATERGVGDDPADLLPSTEEDGGMVFGAPTIAVLDDTGDVVISTDPIAPALVRALRERATAAPAAACFTAKADGAEHGLRIATAQASVDGDPATVAVRVSD